MLPSSICSMGQIPRISPHSYGMLPKQMSKGHPPMITRGGVEKGEVGGNVQSLQVMHGWLWCQSVVLLKLHCIEWILQNQHDDGSWGINSSSLSVNKDILLSTLACVVALKKWNAGSYHIRRGLNFVGRNFSVATDVQNIAHVGFNITFSGLITLASGMGLQLPVWQTDIDEIFHLRKIELERDAGGTISARKAFMAYVAEGFGNLQDWDQVMAYQRKNGSLFNSPSTTAAAAIHSFNDRTLNYLDSLTNKFGGPVPAMYPQNIYSQLCTVDALERTGISQKFAGEIRDILDTTYRSWLHNEEEVMLDIPTCAIAFRLLRTHGYDITSDEMAHFSEQSSFDDSIHGYLNDTKTLLELFKTSQIRFSCEDLVLENIGTWSAKLLKQQLLSNKLSTSAQSEVEYVIKFPLHSTLDRLEHRRNIEQFKVEGSKVLKSGYCGSHSNEEILALAVDYFHSSQSVYQQELKYFESWVKQCRLDELKFARVMPLIVHFISTATMFAPELADARMVLCQTSLLVTVYDDFFDCPETSREEKENYIALIENSAKAMMVEADWTATMYIPATMEEYMSNAEVSAAFASFVCPPLYFLGLKLSEEDVKSHEYTQLLKFTNVIGRLQNDSQTYRKEILAGKVNSVLLRALIDSGNTSPESIEAAKDMVNSDAESSMVEMRSLVFSEGGPIPRPCKDRFWEMCKIVFYFYREDDAYLTPKEMMSSARAVILDPLRLIPPPSCPETSS
uniref:Terpene synthase N-terminal domain-containing protein n=1 Tax=Oryza glumipatula TaxID=40148 RepID=A0A0E0BSX6_9ORYZ